MSRTALICWVSAGGRDSIRNRGLTDDPTLLGDLELEQAVSTARLITSSIRGRYFISLILSLQPAFALQHRLQRLLSLPRQVIRLAVRGILVRHHIRTKSLHSVGNQRRSIAVTAHEFGCWTERQIQNVVDNQHLAVALGTSADADGRSCDLCRDHGRDFPRNAFEINAGHARTIESEIGR